MLLRLLPFLLAAPLLACGDLPEHNGDDNFVDGDGGYDRDGGTAPDGQTVLPASSCKLDEAQTQGPALQPFNDNDELVRYLENVVSRCVPPPAPPRSSYGGSDASAGLSQTASAPPSTSSPTASASANDSSGNETITNNQEVGVDEGDIVKNVGDALVVLRKGRLYAVDVARSGAPVLTDSIRVAATERLNADVWYDELLVHEDLLYVIGYRYGAGLSPTSSSSLFSGASGATEVDVFRLRAGKLARVGQTFIESWDYYSGTNYASRLIDGTLVFYMPSSATRGEHLSDDGARYLGTMSIPRVLRFDETSGQFQVVGPLFTASDVQRPLSGARSPVFHSVVRCKLSSTGTLDCATKAILGPYSRQFYVSAKRVYVWTPAHVFALGLDQWSISAHAVSGAPNTQFAFKELNDTLHVATQAGKTISMLKLPLSAFDQQGKQAPLDETPLATYATQPSVLTERFAGSTYVASVQTYGSGTNLKQRVFYDVTSTRPAQLSESDIGYQRIEPLGEQRALLVGQSSKTYGQLEIETWTLGETAKMESTLSLPGLSQGESRSHAFFYKPLEGMHGTFGLPVLRAIPMSSSWFDRGLANIAFFDVTQEHQISVLGAIAAEGDAAKCETSCYDWYGNTRPIFLRERTFALMGSELRELTLRPGVAALGAPAFLTF